MLTSLPIRRSKRWDLPFTQESDSCSDLVDVEIARLMSIPPFCDMKADSFPKSLPLRGILKNDTRIRRFDDGDCIVRKGDWGSSAFLVLNGSIRAEVDSLEPTEARTEASSATPRRRAPSRAVAELWKKPAESEQSSENKASSVSDTVSFSLTETQTIYLQDVSAALDKNRAAYINPGQWFGEVAALSRTPRIATIIADGPVELLEIRWQGFRDLLRKDKEGCLKQPH